MESLAINVPRHCFFYTGHIRDDVGEAGMAVSIVRLGSPRAGGEGLRIGSVRLPPRGMRKEEYAARDIYDVWFPLFVTRQPERQS